MSLGLLALALVVVGSFRVVGFTRGRPLERLVRSVRSRAPWCRRVHPVSLGSHARGLGVVGLIRGRFVLSRAPWESLG